MSGPQVDGDEGLPVKLEELLRHYESKLDGLKLSVPGLEAPQPPTNYFDDEPAASPAFPAPPAPSAPPAPAPAAAAPSRPPVQSVVLVEPERPKEEDFAPLPVAPASCDLPGAEEPARATSVPWRALAVLAALCAAAYWRAQGASHDLSLPLAVAHPAGLTGDGGKIYSIDADKGALLVFSSDGTLKSREKLANPAAFSLTFQPDGSFWSTDAQSGVLYEHGRDEARSVRRVYAYPNRRFSAVDFNGDALWAVDSRTGVIYQYLPVKLLTGPSLTPLNQYGPLAGAVGAVGMRLLDNKLWLCSGRKITRYRQDSSGFVPADWLDLDSKLPENAAVAGFYADKDFIWLVTTGPARLLRLDARRLPWRRA